jgi:2-keto-4-pentenoate hydratase/2-oxohepta-3-ene-1,7-dioic acid hydratase in catechol pathway
MKLIRFVSTDSSYPSFGVVIGKYAVSFAVLQAKVGTLYECLFDSQSYLANLPDSEEAARELLNWGEKNFQKIDQEKRFPLDSVKLKEPVEVAALFDFGLTPQHLKNSFETMMKYEKDDPQTGPILQAVSAWLVKDAAAEETRKLEPLPYYKSNMNSIVGDGEVIPWPQYTARLDIEPELAVVYGNTMQPIAGFCGFNDISARDVQAPEFIGGLCLTKDMAAGNQLGPYLVTLDEVGDPYDLDISVIVNKKLRFSGSTSEISHKAEDVIAWLEAACPLKPGTVMGMGTIPGCTGLDFDDFLDPGDEIEISFERLGSLSCQFAEPRGMLHPSRWPIRQPLERYNF